MARDRLYVVLLWPTFGKVIKRVFTVQNLLKLKMRSNLLKKMSKGKKTMKSKLKSVQISKF